MGYLTKDIPEHIKSRNIARMAIARENEEKIWELRKIGLSFTSIGKQLGISKTAAYEGYRRVLKANRDHLREMAEEMVMLHVARLEEASSLQFRIMSGRPLAEGEPPPTAELRLDASQALVKTGESIRKLLGLDKPEQVEHGGSIALVPVNLQELEGDDLKEEVGSLTAGLRTVDTDKVQAVAQLPAPSDNGSNN